MNGAEELNDRFYTGFILMLCGVCVFFALFVLIVIFGKKIKVKWNKVIFFGLFALSVCATALFVVRFSGFRNCPKRGLSDDDGNRDGIRESGLF